jgi:methylglutaconyl-CoA hydratase
VNLEVEFTGCRIMQYQTLNIDKYKNQVVLRLNRPNVRNAMNGLMLDELIYFLENVHQEKSCKLLLVRGEGKVFSAGADLNWMAQAVNATYNENVEESRKLYRVFKLFSTLPMVTVAWLHGAAIGGALGIAAGADFVWVDKDVKILFSEVKLGLVPATVAPVVIKRIGATKAKQWMMSAKMLSVNELISSGFADEIVMADNLPDKLDDLINQLNDNDLNAIQITKELIRNVSESVDDESEELYTAGVIARARASESAQVRIKHFLESKNITS